MKLPDVFGISAKNDAALRVPMHGSRGFPVDSLPQILTDMVNGGAAYWMQEENGEKTMKYRSLPG